MRASLTMTWGSWGARRPGLTCAYGAKDGRVYRHSGNNDVILLTPFFVVLSC